MEEERAKEFSSDQLKPGDLIFTLDSSGNPGHVAVWAPEEGSVRPLAHAVNSHTTQKITKTFLPPSDNYVVFRVKDPNLAKLAAVQANRWCSYETPYDETRLQIGERLAGSLQHRAKNPEEWVQNRWREFEKKNKGKMTLLLWICPMVLFFGILAAQMYASYLKNGYIPGTDYVFLGICLVSIFILRPLQRYFRVKKLKNEQNIDPQL